MPEHRYDDEPHTEPLYDEPPREVVHEHREVRQPVPYHEEPAEDHPVIHGTGTSWTSIALVKYGFILIMVVIILYFIAQFVLPLLT